MKKTFLKKLISLYLSLFLLFGLSFSFLIYAEEAEIEVENDNEATVSGQIHVQADSGDNLIEAATESASLETAVIKTGDTVAQASSVALVNTNLVDSDFEYLVLNDEDLVGGADFSKDQQELESGLNDESEPSRVVVIENENLAEVDLTTTAIASSGGNEIVAASEGEINTGDAFALANSVAVVNTNFTESNFSYTIINVFDSLEGDLVFPVPDSFLISASQEISNDNTATVENTTVASASSDNNQITGTGSSAIETGKAISIANTFNWINQNFVGVNFFSLLFNHFGSWEGSLRNWEGAGSVQDLGQGTYLFQFESLAAETERLEVVNENETMVTTATSADASTGNNQINQGGAGEIVTGQAIAVANSINVINSNFTQSNFFFSIFNLFGEFKGDLVFDCPDLSIEITDPQENDSDDQDGFSGEVKLTILSSNNVADFIYPGDTVLFKIVVKNEGDRLARKVILFNQLYNQISDPLDEVRIDLDDLEPGEEKIIEFGYTLPDQPTMIYSGTHRLESWLEANDEEGKEVTSNVGITYFKVQAKGDFNLVSPVSVTEDDQVLGTGDEVNLNPETEEKLWPRLLLLIMFALWLVGKSRRVLIQRRIESGSKLG